MLLPHGVIGAWIDALNVLADMLDGAPRAQSVATQRMMNWVLGMAQKCDYLLWATTTQSHAFTMIQCNHKQSSLRFITTTNA